MPSASEIKQQVARESERRARLGVPAFAGGILFFLSTIIATATVNSLPTVGIVQGLTPALHGRGSALVSPRAAEVKAISHDAFALIAGSVVKSIALLALTLVLALLLDATRFRRPETWAPARALVLAGGGALAVINVVHQAVTAVKAHSFAVGHDFSRHAVDEALSKGAVNVTGQVLDLLAALALAVGMIVVCVNATRVGLLTRWMTWIGVFSAVLIILPIGGATLEIVPAFWLVAMGVLYMGRWHGGDPPAWQAGVARPWPTQAELRAEREAARTGTPAPAKAARQTPATAAGQAPVEQPAHTPPARAGDAQAGDAQAGEVGEGEAAPEPTRRRDDDQAPRPTRKRRRRRGARR
jgi:hypothetical protein